MRLNISKPIVVATGPDARTGGWGPFQFPRLTQLADGRILYEFHIGSDTESEYGKEQGCCLSEDMGKTWLPVRAKDFELLSGMLLLNGDRIHFPGVKSILVTPDMDLGKPVGHVIRKNQDCYRVENISRDICSDTWLLSRVRCGTATTEISPVKLNWPNMVLRVCRGLLVPPMTMGRLRQGPDGTLWMTHYDIGNDPVTNEFTGYLANYLFRSTDYGYSWDLMHYLPFYPNEIPHPDAGKWEGFGENDITYAPDGSLIRLIRTNGGFRKGTNGFCYLVRSLDGGYTWSDPVIFDHLAVWPRLLTLKCGVTLASYGRPGFFLRATKDPSCLKWGDPIELVHSDLEPNPCEESVLNTATCSYSDMIALDDHTALLAYSDFTIPDKDGIPRKTMLVRFISVEEDKS